MTFPDPYKSRAVIIGVSEYTTLPSLPAVRSNVEALKEILTTQLSWNLPSEHCVVIQNPRTPEELVDPIVQSAEEATDTLLVYYAGHGLKGANRGEFRLSRSTSRAGASHTSTDYNDIREALIESTAARRIVILDCCYAASALGVMADPAHAVAEDAVVEGTYLIAAAGETQVAMSDDGGGFTVFTGELVRLIRAGVPDETKRFIDLDTAFTHLRSSLRAKARPLPHKRVRNSPGGLTLAKNKKWRGWGDFPPAREAQKLEPPKIEQVPQAAAGPLSNILDGRGWPTTENAQPSSSAASVEAATPAVPGLLPADERRPGGWPTAKKTQPPSSAPPTEAAPAVPGLLAPDERRPGGWPTTKKAQPPSSAPPAEAAPAVPGLLAPAVEGSGLLPADERRPGGWPTAKKTQPSSSAPPTEAAPTDRPRPGAWPVAKKAAPPLAEAVNSDSERTVWPNVKQPPRRDATGLPAFEQVWSRILEEVKGRRRFAWILLRDTAKVVQFDGETIELEFLNESSKANYWSAGVQHVLGDVIREKFDISWRVEVADRKAPAPAVTARVSDGTGESTRRPGEWPKSPKLNSAEGAGGLSEIQKLWSTILEVVKTQRRFTWLLLSQNAKATRLDGNKLRIEFINEGSRETFMSSGSHEVMERAICEHFGTSWEIDVATRREPN
ncbi:caspase family protein [Streptomyces sp. NPDC046870]|uniref:caspase, EACC1-associated type n=1 Tax=Streptomyces sp. NPDC046870 TaxID=3155135 RepID=UPI0034572EB3